MGRIGKPHGVRGWVTVSVTTDEPERRFATGATVLLGDSPQVIAESRLAPRVVVRFAQCTDRDDAENLRGQWLYVDIEDERPTDPDEYYDHQLIGMGVLVAGSRVGTVAEVLHLPSQDVLAVDTGARQVLVPFVEQLVPRVDLALGIVEVAEMAGLFDDAD